MSENAEHSVSCWADPLGSRERTKVARMLARHCKRFYDAGTTAPDGRRATSRQIVHALVSTSAEMSDLHLDLTERACRPEQLAEAAMFAVTAPLDHDMAPSRRQWVDFSWECQRCGRMAYHEGGDTWGTATEALCDSDVEED